MPSHLTQRGRKTLWTKNDSHGNCWLCNGWVHIGRKLRRYSGWESNSSYGLCLGHAKLASPVQSYSLNPMYDFSLLEKGKSLVKAKPASERDGEELHLCHLCSIWDQVARVQPIWEQNARKEAGDKLSVSFNICKLSALLISVNVSCYYPDFNLPCPLLWFIWALRPSSRYQFCSGGNGLRQHR